MDSEELVLDDIVIFKAGNQICADAIVVSGEVRVNESLLTGESDEITKAPGAELLRPEVLVAESAVPVLIKSEWILTFPS